MTAQVVKNLFHKKYLILKFRNVVKFYVHVRPIFSYLLLLSYVELYSLFILILMYVALKTQVAVFQWMILPYCVGYGLIETTTL